LADTTQVRTFPDLLQLVVLLADLSQKPYFAPYWPIAFTRQLAFAAPVATANVILDVPVPDTLALQVAACAYWLPASMLKTMTARPIFVLDEMKDIAVPFVRLDVLPSHGHIAHWRNLHDGERNNEIGVDWCS
jgi:hypothetical protein